MQIVCFARQISHADISGSDFLSVDGSREEGSASLQMSHPLHASDGSPGVNEFVILYVGFVFK